MTVGMNPAPHPRMLTPLVDQYLRHKLTLREHRASTHRVARAVLRGFAGHCRQGHVTRGAVERWAASRTHLAASTFATEWRTVRRFVRWLVAEGHLAADPMTGMTPPRVPRSVPRALGAEQVAAIIAAAPDERARAIVWVLVGCGLRRSELAALRFEDWDRSNHTFRVHGKGGHVRLVAVPPEVEGPLARYLAVSPAHHGPIFRRADGKALEAGTIGNYFRRWAYAAGVKGSAWDGVGCHSLRHTCAWDVLRNGANVRLVQQMLGHASLSSTQVYLGHASPDEMRAAMSGRPYAA